MMSEHTLAIEDIFQDEGGAPLAPAALTARKAQQGGKSETAFRTISEVAEFLEVPQHVLRFWETKFSQIRPLKRGGGRRYYRPEDVALLRRIHTLLYTEGYTIRGVQKLLRSQGRQAPNAAPESSLLAAPPAARAAPDGHEEAAPSPHEVLAALLPGPPPAGNPARAPASGLSLRQRSLLEGLLEDLRDLRTLVAASESLGSRAA